METKEFWMTQNFVRVPVWDEITQDYIKFRVFWDDETPRADEIEQFDTAVFYGYHWPTLSFRTKWIYDLYRIYNKAWDLLLETEDEIVENLVELYDIAVIYAYNKKDNGYEIAWQCIDTRFLTVPNRMGSKKYKLSVVVPLYKSELFMCRTIDSILSSTLEDIELILIDDWSDDNSYEIAQRYEANWKCVRAYHQENQGVSFARNRWLELATWEYIAFCDNDDIIHPFMYELLYNTCKEQNTDIAICPALIRTDFNKSELYLTCSAREARTVVYTFEELVKNRRSKWNIFWVAVRNKIVKTEVARLAKFPTDYTGPWILYEDVAYTWSLYSYIDRFALCKDALYTWDKRKQKTVGTASTWHSACDNEYVWKMFVYGFSYPIYHKSDKHVELSDFTHFKRLIQSYDKFDRPSPLRTHWDTELKKLINSQKLYDNKYIMEDKHLSEIVNRLKG